MNKRRMIMCKQAKLWKLVLSLLQIICRYQSKQKEIVKKVLCPNSVKCDVTSAKQNNCKVALLLIIMVCMSGPVIALGTLTQGNMFWK